MVGSRRDPARWAALRHAFGRASDLPGLLDDLRGAAAEDRDGILEEITGRICHQGTRYDASAEVLPLLGELVADPAFSHRREVLVLMVHTLLGSFDPWLLAGFDAEALASQPDPALLQRLSEGFDAALGALREAAAADDAGVREAAAMALAFTLRRRPETRGLLAARLAVEANPSVRCSLHLALSSLGGAAALHRDALAASNPLVERIGAAIALAREGGDLGAVVRAVLLQAVALGTGLADAGGPPAISWMDGNLHHLAGELLARRGAALAEPTWVVELDKDASGWMIDGRIVVAGALTKVGCARTGAVLFYDRALARIPTSPLLPDRADGDGLTDVASDEGDGVVAVGRFLDPCSGARHGGPVAVHVRPGAPPRLLAEARRDGVEPKLCFITRVAVAAGRVWIAGKFTQLAGAARANLGILWLDTGALAPPVPELDGELVGLRAVGPRVILVAKRADHALVVEAREATGDLVWRHVIEDAGPLTLTELVASEEQVFAFVACGGTKHVDVTDNVRVLDARTGAPIASRFPPLPRVSSAFATPDTLYVAGWLRRVGDEARPVMAAFDARTGALAPPEARLASGTPYGMCRWDRALVLAGSITLPGGDQEHTAVVVDLESGRAQPLPEAPHHASLRAVVASGALVLGSRTNTKAGGVSRRGFAVLDAATGQLDPRELPLDGPVLAVAPAGPGEIFVAGRFQRWGDDPCRFLCRVRLATGEVLPCAAVDGAVRQLLVHDARVYLAGDFTSIDGQPRDGIGALERASGARSSWSTEVSGTASALAADGTHLYLGGELRRGRAGRTLHVVAVTHADGARTALPDTDGPVAALAVRDRTLFVGGDFGALGRVDDPFLSSIDLARGVPVALGARLDRTVESLAADRDLLVVTGTFTTAAGKPRHELAVFGADGALLDWVPSRPGRAILRDDSLTLVAGHVARYLRPAAGRRR